MEKLKRYFLIAFGTLNVGLGILGVFLPLMPTTVFLLIAAACYVRSSDTLYNRLISHPRFGPLIKNYREHRAMPRSAKYKAVFVLWFTLSISAFMVQEPVVWGILVGVGVMVSLIILTTKTLENLNIEES